MMNNLHVTLNRQSTRITLIFKANNLFLPLPILTSIGLRIVRSDDGVGVHAQ